MPNVSLITQRNTVYTVRHFSGTRAYLRARIGYSHILKHK